MLTNSRCGQEAMRRFPPWSDATIPVIEMPDLPQPLAESLSALGPILAPAREQWWIIGSAAVALHGADPGTVADIDILLSPGDAALVVATLGLEAQRASGSSKFRSEIFAVWYGLPLPVEFMAGFQYRSGGSWHTVRPTSRQKIMLGNSAIFVPARDELIALLCGFYRPKDRMRAERLADI